MRKLNLSTPPLHHPIPNTKHLQNTLSQKTSFKTNIQIRHFSTPLKLHEAVTNTNIPEIKQIIYKRKQNINSINEKGNTPLHLAAETKNKLICEILIKHNASAKIKNIDNKTALDIYPEIKELYESRQKSIQDQKESPWAIRLKQDNTNHQESSVQRYSPEMINCSFGVFFFLEFGVWKFQIWDVCWCVCVCVCV